MTVEIARNRIAKIRNDMCYSHTSKAQMSAEDIKKINKEASEIVNWFEIR